MVNTDELYIQRCIDLAAQGRGQVAPNPMVGCVLVYDDTIIGEGYHQQYGGPHAEVNAIKNAEEIYPDLVEKATLYVNLEPCSHFGKTPPCADLIISKKIKKVVAGTLDPNPLVAGSGMKKLRDAGVEVIVEVLDSECRELNKRFFTAIEKRRPYVILKWAQTADGLMAPADKSRTAISNKLSHELAHKWRSEEQAILVGYNTALHDNPELNVRLWDGRNPLRCVIDRDLQLPNNLHLFDKSIPTLVFNGVKSEKHVNLQYIKLDFSGEWLKELLQKLQDINIQSVIIEGGAKTLEMFIQQNLWDEARVFTAQVEWKEGIKAPELSILPGETQMILNDKLVIYRND